MSPTNLVVARFLDGSVLKGVAQDFSPQRPTFHVLPPGGGRGVVVQLAGLKAVFFVKSLAGDPDRPDVRGFLAAPAEGTHGRKIAIRFPDAELICGYAHSYAPNRAGFFVFPADSGGNNQRVFVVIANAGEILEGPAAEALARRIFGSEAA